MTEWRAIMKHSTLAALVSISTSAVVLSMGTTPVQSAEEVRLVYGAAERSIPVESLANFANQGELDSDLEPYMRGLSDTEIADVRDALNYRINVNFSPFAKFLSTDLGSAILSEMTAIVSPQSPSVDGVQALRASLNTASQDGHFSVLDLIEKYPTSSVDIDVKEIAEDVAIAEEIVNDVQQTEHALSGMHNLAGSLELLAESFLNQDTGGQLVTDSESFIAKVEDFAQTSGLTAIDLDSQTPPDGTISLSKADIWQLYQDFQSLEAEAEEFLDAPFTEGSGVN